MSLDEAPRFSMQGLSNALADVREGTGETPAEEYTMMLEVIMVDHPGWPRPPHFLGMWGWLCTYWRAIQFLESWNMCKWMAWVLLTCSFMTSRAIGVWGRMPCMLSGPTWRRFLQSGSHALPTSPLASSL